MQSSQYTNLAVRMKGRKKSFGLNRVEEIIACFFGWGVVYWDIDVFD